MVLKFLSILGCQTALCFFVFPSSRAWPLLQTKQFNCTLLLPCFFYCFSVKSSETKVMTIFPYFELSINILRSVGFLVDFPSRSRKATITFRYLAWMEVKKKKKPVKNLCSGGSVQRMKKRWGTQVLAVVQELRPNIATKESRRGRNTESLSLRKYFQECQALSVSEQKTPWRVSIYARSSGKHPRNDS